MTNKNLLPVPLKYTYPAIMKILDTNNDVRVYIPERNIFCLERKLLDVIKEANLDYIQWKYRWFSKKLVEICDDDWAIGMTDWLYKNKPTLTRNFIINQFKLNKDYRCNFSLLKEDFINLYYKSRKDNNRPIYNYDFSKVPDYIKYQTTKISIICNEINPKTGDIIGEWKTTYNIFIYSLKDHFILGRQKFSKSMTYTNEEFLQKAKNLYSNDYEYLDEYVDGDTPIRIKCNNCGTIFSMTPHEFFRKRKRRSLDTSFYNCPNCKKVYTSYGEEYVSRWLNSYNIQYISRALVRDIEGKTKGSHIVRVDFCLDNYNGKTIWIEYNGIQHYRKVKHFHSNDIGRSFEDQLRRDENVRQYCKENNILFIEIPYIYNTYEKVEQLLNKVIINNEDINTIIDYSKLYKI